MKSFQYYLMIALLLLAPSVWAESAVESAVESENATAETDICAAINIEKAGPKEAIECTVNSIIQTLQSRENKERLTEQDRDNIRQAILGRFDYRYMARLSLGSKTWKTLDEAAQEHFIAVNQEMLERSYGNRLVEYNNQKVVFDDAKLKETKKGTIARVKSKVIDGTREIPVDYKLHPSENGWKVYEIYIEGAGMVRTKFKEYKKVREDHGYDVLIKKLENKLAKLREKDHG